METVLVKILAVVLALSQVSTRPDEVRTHFDSTADRAQVLALLRGGCAHMRKVFEIEDLPLDELVDTALADPKALTSDIKAFHGINFADLGATYRELCKNETPDPSPIDEYGWMYGRSFEDPDGHGWGVNYMDMEAFKAQFAAENA